MFYADTSCDTLSLHKDESVEKKSRVRVFLSTPPVGYNGSLSTGNETNCNKQERSEQNKKCELTSNSIQMHTTTRDLEMKAHITILKVGQFERWTSNLRRKLLVLVVFVFVDLDGDALQLVFLVRGVDDFSSRQRL